MKIEEISQLLNLKHIILCGGSESRRKGLLRAVLEFVDKDRTEIYKISTGVDNSDEFINAVRYIFPIKSPIGDPVEEMSNDQIHDVLLDWVEQGDKSTLIIWEEIGSFESKDTLYTLINDFVTEKYILENYFRRQQQLRLLASSEADLRDYFNSAEIYFGRDPRDPSTNEQVARNSLEIINLDESS